jgi:hypothetical protein
MLTSQASCEACRSNKVGAHCYFCPRQAHGKTRYDVYDLQIVPSVLDAVCTSSFSLMAAQEFIGRYDTPCMDPTVNKPKGRPPRYLVIILQSPRPTLIPPRRVFSSVDPDPSHSQYDTFHNTSFALSAPYAPTSSHNPNAQRASTSYQSSPPNTFGSSSTPGIAKSLNMAEYLDPGDRDLVEHVPRAPWFNNTPSTVAERAGMRVRDGLTERDDPGE